VLNGEGTLQGDRDMDRAPRVALDVCASFTALLARRLLPVAIGAAFFTAVRAS